MSPLDRVKVLLFLGLFFGAVGFLSMLLCCGTEYWLLATETCLQADPGRGEGDKRGRDDSNQVVTGVRVFHEGLLWRCSYSSASPHPSIWDLWITNPPPLKLCQMAFLFPFPHSEPKLVGPQSHPAYEPPSAIVFRTFWSIFLVSAVSAILIGWFCIICASSQTNYRLYNVAGGLQIFGGVSLLAVLVMYLMWTEVLDVLEQFALQQRKSNCPSFHLSVQHGPSFLLAPVSIFFCLLAGLILLLVARSMPPAESNQMKHIQQLPVMETDL